MWSDWKNHKGLNQRSLVPLGPTIIYITGYQHKTLCPLFQQLFCAQQTLIRISQNKLFCVMSINQYILIVPDIPLLKKRKKINKKTWKG